MQKATYWNNKGNGSELNGRTATILNKDCIENELKDKAWKLLRNRSDYEYENVELETLE